MSFSVPDILPSIIIALQGSASITDYLPAWKGGYPIHTRRPAPAGSPKPYILAGPYVSVNDTLQSIGKSRLEIILDIAVYDNQEKASEYRSVETLSKNIFNLFHRQPDALTVSGYQVVQIIASGPIPAPADADDIQGRVVTLTVTIQPT